ncbi:MAG TPA: metal-dependent transcriptional regulator [Planctomycetaceae bacterium]|nr:metal-dependent transcriptional regulator [Planctomycetaceae bacterium]
MPSLTVENYLKAILQITLRSGSEWVSTGALASELEVSPGTVTSMLKTLAESKTGRGKRPALVLYKPYEGVQLTAEGRRLAVRMLRRHRLIELFLVQTLNLTWDRVHEEAEHMEHAVSDFLIDRIDEYLGRPQVDPHGDPIPTAEGEMRGDADAAVPLTNCRPGTRVRVVRVTNQGPDFLRYLSDAGFELGAEGVVEENNREAGIVTTKLPVGSVPMAHSAAQSLLVEEIAG